MGRKRRRDTWKSERRPFGPAFLMINPAVNCLNLKKVAVSRRLGPAGDGPKGRRRAPLSRGDPDRPNEVRNGGVDEARTRDLRRDRPAF
jgi:hypothetical protein